MIEKIGNELRRDVAAFAKDHDVPILMLKKPDRSDWDDRKLDHVRPYVDHTATQVRFGVVAIVAAQEFQWVFSASKKTGPGGGVHSTGPKPSSRFSEEAFDIGDDGFVSLGAHRLTGEPAPLMPGQAAVHLRGQDLSRAISPRVSLGRVGRDRLGGHG